MAVSIDSADDGFANLSTTVMKEQTLPSLSYWEMIVKYPNYRYFLISYIVTQLGEWLTYVASLSILEKTTKFVSTTIDESNVYSQLPLSTSSSSGHSLIAMLVVCRLLPNTLLSFAGGMLADTCDRKRTMYILDICGGCVALCYWMMSTIQVQHSQPYMDHKTTIKVIILYSCAIAQSSISGLYQPNRSSIVPLLVNKEKGNIEKANIVSTIIWSLSAAVGSSLGGFIMNHAGASSCFIIDMILYFTSATILALLVHGTYNVTELQQNQSVKSEISNNEVNEKENFGIIRKQVQKQHHNRFHPLKKLVYEVHDFIITHDSSPYLLIKGCGALLFGASDVINVTFAQDESGTLNPQRLGYIFAAVGIGCLLGPILLPSKRNYVSSCISSYFIISISYACMAWSKNFWFKCFWTGIRAGGSAVLWVDSTILLQTTVSATILGRISSMDYALAALGEALSALFAGYGQDFGLSAQIISLLLSGLGLCLGLLWFVATYYCRTQSRQKKFVSEHVIAPDEIELFQVN